MTRAEAATAMIDSASAFYAFGWLLGTSGNLSVRLNADEFLITASGRNKGELTPEDFLVCSRDGRPGAQDALRPSAETEVHTRLYSNFESVGAIYHVHEPYSALCSARDFTDGGTTFEGLEMIKGLDIWEEGARVIVPIVDNFHSIPRLAEAIVDIATANVPGVMVHNHGFYAWGDGPAEARRHVETLAYLYRYSWESQS